MICLVCRQTEVVDELTLIAFKRGDFTWIVNRVPARICPGCGEAYVEEAIAVRLLNSARERCEAGIVDTETEYSAL